MISQTDGLNHTTNYGYDHLDRQITTMDAAGRVTANSYEAAGNVLTTKQSGNGDTTLTTTNNYDAADELITVSYSDSSTHGVVYTYDNDGQRQSMTDGSGTSSYLIDSLHRLTQVTNGAGKIVKYGYDLTGNATSITYPGNDVVTRGFDDASRLTSVTDWLTATPTTFGYDVDGNWASTTYANTVTGTRSYDDADNLTAISYSHGTTVLGTYTYTRTSANLLATTTPTNGAPGTSDTYAYTSNGQLKSTTGATASTIWAYDAADRITQNPAGTVFAYDNADQLTTSTPASGPATTYGYDNRGNRTSNQIGTTAATTYAYNQANQMTGYTTPSGTTSTYAYDGDGIRTAKTPDGGNTQLMTWDIATDSIPLLLNDGTTSYLYGPDGTPLEQVAGTTPTYLHQDQLGSTCFITSSAGSINGTYSYTPYGQATHTGTAITALQYNGQYTDAETGLIYLRARYYDPASTQFLTVDPLVALTGVAYSYPAGNPLTFTDPTGLFCWNWSASCVLGDVHEGSGIVGTVAAGCAVVLALTVAGGAACGAVALGASAITAGTGAARLAMGDQSKGQFFSDLASLGADGLGFGAAKRAENLYEASRDAKALGVGRWFGVRWLQNAKAWGLRLEAGGYWFTGMSIDIGSLGYNIYGSTSSLVGDLSSGNAC